MTQNVRRDVLAGQGWAAVDRSPDVFGQQPGDRVGAQWEPAPAGKQRIGGVAGSFARVEVDEQGTVVRRSDRLGASGAGAGYAIGVARATTRATDAAVGRPWTWARPASMSKPTRRGCPVPARGSGRRGALGPARRRAHSRLRPNRGMADHDVRQERGHRTDAGRLAASRWLFFARR